SYPSAACPDCRPAEYAASMSSARTSGAGLELSLGSVRFLYLATRSAINSLKPIVPSSSIPNLDCRFGAWSQSSPNTARHLIMLAGDDFSLIDLRLGSA